MLVTHTQMGNQIEKSADFFLLVWFIFWWIRPIYSRTCWTQSLVCCLHLSWVNGPEISFLPNFLIFELVRCHRPVSCDLNGFHPVFVDVEVPYKVGPELLLNRDQWDHHVSVVLSQQSTHLSLQIFTYCVWTVGTCSHSIHFSVMMLFLY